MANGTITIVNNLQDAIQVMVSKNGAGLAGALTSGWLRANTASGFLVSGYDLYDVGFISDQSADYKYGYLWTHNVGAPSRVTIAATVSTATGEEEQPEG